MTAAIGIQIGIGTEIDEKARISTPIAISISVFLLILTPEALAKPLVAWASRP
jgi:hypothetical protein